MSRVEDDREAARVEARLLEQKRTEAMRKSSRVAVEDKFSRLVGAEREASRLPPPPRAPAKSALAHALEGADGERRGAARAQGERATRAGTAARALAGLDAGSRREAQEASARADGRHGAAARGTDGQLQEQQSAGRSADGRRSDARGGRERADARRREADAQGSQPGASALSERAPGERNRRVGAAGSGEQSGGRGAGEGAGAGAAATFRLNPALMEPAPVAQQRAASGSDRLRKVANELAQRIVERVRVGTNAAGRAEFQIDFRQEVLAGLSVKVSAQHGRIRAVFSGSDRRTLDLVEGHLDMLKGALAGRGLTLEDVTIEGRP